jgi:large subunit ribosomal protein L2
VRPAAAVKQSYRIGSSGASSIFPPSRADRIRSEPDILVALIRYADGDLSYIIARSARPGDEVISGARADVKPGNAMALATVLIGRRS